MKKFRVVITSAKDVKLLNDKIATDSLFTVGETITNNPLRVGVNVVTDERIKDSMRELANKPLNAAVGDCLCGVGKVVHTLPLPPPRSKRMSKITKVNQLIKKQKWKRIFVYLADLHSEMANAIDL